VPSPVGHFIGGVAAGWLVAGAPAPSSPAARSSAALWSEAIVFGLLGIVPDFDLFFGSHRTATHSIGAAFIVAGLAILVWMSRLAGNRFASLGLWRFACACAAACASHALLDWLGRDTSAPFGIMALWPFSTTYYESGLHLFPAISRRYYQGWTFIDRNVRAVGLEVAILGPILLLVIIFRRRHSTFAERR
jgi:inner membrane protein